MWDELGMNCLLKGVVVYHNLFLTIHPQKNDSLAFLYKYRVRFDVVATVTQPLKVMQVESVTITNENKGNFTYYGTSGKGRRSNRRFNIDTDVYIGRCLGLH